MITALGFAAVLALSYLLAFHLVPRVARRLGLGRHPNPLLVKRAQRFRRIGRGYWSFVLMVTLFVASLFLELYVNSKPLYIRYGDTVRYPAVADWLNFLWPVNPRPTQILAADFGVPAEGELDARRYAAWVRDPARLSQEIEQVERDIAADEARFRKMMTEQAARRGLTYDPREPLPAAKLEDYQERRARARRLGELQKELQAGKAAIVMPLYPYSPGEQLLDLPGAPPHRPFQKGLPVLGTDFGGRDVLSQLLYGFRITLSFALIVTALGYFFGVLVGASMGYFGGWYDILVQRGVEIWSSIPFFYTIMILASILTPGFWTLVLLLAALVGWVSITYTIRGEFYREKARDYVQAARALGVGDWAIMFRHILPNALVPLVTFAPFAIVADMSTLVALDYLGFGLPPGTPSWGVLLRQGAENVLNHPQLVYIPVLAFAGTLFCVVLIGEAVREAFDPRAYARLR